MTRRDYVLLAEALKNARPWNYDVNQRASSSVAWLACVYGIAQAIFKENPRFDYNKFQDDCGTTPEHRQEMCYYCQANPMDKHVGGALLPACSECIDNGSAR